ncbi:MAG: hypothetical protein R2849_13225 [Thermomicrobiales bacterium]
MKILVVKLADLGDLLISEPALRSLGLGFPKARIDVLTTPHAAVLLPDIAPGAHALTFEKASFDAPGLGAAASVRSAASLGARLRAAGYDRVVLLHHLDNLGNDQIPRTSPSDRGEHDRRARQWTWRVPDPSSARPRVRL